MVKKIWVRRGSWVFLFYVRCYFIKRAEDLGYWVRRIRGFFILEVGVDFVVGE